MIIRFTQDMSELEEILLQKVMIPQFRIEKMGNLSLENDGRQLEFVACPGINFYENKFADIEKLAETYGNFAIAFRKEWAMEQGIQPVCYMTENSPLMADTRDAFRSLKRNETEIPTELTPIMKYLIGKILLMKPYEKDERCLQEEQEWIYLPEEAVALSRFVYEKNGGGLKKYCGEMDQTLRKLEISKLHFDDQDIEKIYLPDQKTVDQLISKVTEIGGMEKKERLLKKFASKMHILKR